MDTAPDGWNWLKDLLGDYANALTTISIVIGAVMAVGVFMRERISRLWVRWRRPSPHESLRAEMARIRSHGTLTRSGITIGKILEDPFLWVEPRFIDAQRQHVQGTPSITQIRVEDLCGMLTSSRQFQRTAIIGGAGRGKSTLARKLFCDLADAYERHHSRRYPVFIDLAEPLSPNSQQSRFTVPPAQRHDVQRLVALAARDGAILVIDGVDEALYSGRRGDVTSVLTLTGTKDVAISFVRDSTFVEFLKYSPELAPTRTLCFADYDANLLINFGRAILEKAWSVPAHRHPALIAPLADAVNRGVVLAPMHVVMALENSLTSPASGVPTFDSLASVYGGYVDSLLQREAAAVNPGLRSFQAKAVLEHACGALVLRAAPGTTFQSPGVTFGLADIREACEAVLGDGNALAAEGGAPTWVVWRSLLEPTTTAGVDTGRWKFTHPSFIDFFVACHILRQLESNAGRIARLMAVHMPQEVYEFLKMFIGTDVDARRAGQIVSVARELFLEHLSGATDGNELDELRIEQVTYLVAHIRTPDAIALAREVARRLPTPFVARGVAIGLSFGGVQEDLYRYVQDLELEYRDCGLGPKNSLNLAHQLAYFGDVLSQFQTRPADTQIASAVQVVRKLISQLRSALHHASRVVDLYTVEVVLRLAMSNETLRMECKAMVSVIADLLSTPELRDDTQLTHRIQCLTQALEQIQTRIATENAT